MDEKRLRRAPNLTEKCAAFALEYQRLKGDPIDRELAKSMTAAQIVSLFEFDHAVYATFGGSTHPTNLTPMLIAEHRDKTQKVDVPNIAKAKRLHANYEEFARARGLDDAPVAVDLRPAWDYVYGAPRSRKIKRKIPSRPFGRRKVK